MTKCLVIGGDGFIGTHLVSKLVLSGRAVTVLDRTGLIPGEEKRGIAHVRGDFADLPLIEKLVAEHDEVIHLAYATVPNTSFDDPLADLTQNLPPAVQLFNVVAKKGAKLLLVSSGGTVYGEAHSLPILESHPTRPISPYGLTKLTLENYAHLYANIRGLQFVCVRPANAYGVGQRPFVGQGFVSTALATAMRGDPVTIYGEQGTVRDYVHVEDLATGMVTALEHGEPDGTYNIGSSIGRSNLDVVQAIAPLLKEIGADVRVNHAPARPFDVQANVLDCSRLRELGWEPRVDFRQGLKQTLEWLMQ